MVLPHVRVAVHYNIALFSPAIVILIELSTSMPDLMWLPGRDLALVYALAPNADLEAAP